MNLQTTDKKFNGFLRDIRTLFQKQKGRILFQKRNTLKLLNYKEEKYVVKSFKVPHLLNQIVYRFFRASKAQRSYENAVRLQKLHINTPVPIGYVEFPSFFLFKESYYVSEFFDYDFEIRALLSESNFEQREEILKAFVAFSFNLHNQGVFHVDFSPGNILIKKKDSLYEFSLIDVNRMKFLPFTDELRMKAFAKLSASKEDRVFIVEEYLKLHPMNDALAHEHMELFHQEHQAYIENKKRLKRLKKARQ